MSGRASGDAIQRIAVITINARTFNLNIVPSYDGKRYSEYPEGNAPGASVWLEEDFSTYTNTANMLADPGGIYSTGEDQNTGDMVLDTTSGYDSLTQCMRYDWPDRSGVCTGYTIGRNITLPTTVTQLWVEIVVRFSAVWSSVNAGCGGISSPSYKLLFGRINGISSRFDVVVGNGGSGNDVWVGYPTSEEDTMIATKMTDLVDDAWHTIRCYWKLGSGNGATKVWVDGSVEADLTGIDTGGATNIYGLALGRNINQGPDQTQSLKWGRVRVWNVNPGW